MTSAAAEAPFAGDIGAGHVLGRYELLLPIATGGMAMVWAARLRGSRGFQKIVAVKTILPKLSEDASFEQMFLDEAALASQIRHPHVVEILDLGEQDGVLFLVMEWIDGLPLNHVIKTARAVGGVPLPVAVRTCMQACAGLHAAHELRDPQGQLVGLVHRDVSPQNILVTYDGVAKVVDFGVAKATALGGGATLAGQVKGKAAYMAPEQIKDSKIDRRVDVFAMGVVLYALTTGKHPFRKESDAATMYEICSPTPVVSPRRVVPGYPLALERVVMQALAKDPARRYPTANDLLRALDQSLPSTMRASTDEEVAKFVHSIFTEKREQQKLALQAALERADQRARNPMPLKVFLDSHPPPSVSGSGVSDVSMVGSGERSGMLPSSADSGSIPINTGPTTAPLSPPGFDTPDFRPKRGRAVGVFLLLVALGLAATGAYLGRGLILGESSPAAEAAKPAPAPPKPLETAPAPPATAEPTAEPAATAAEAKSAEVEPAVTAQKTGGKRYTAPGGGQRGAKPKGGEKPAGGANWKHDPGF